MAKNKGGRPTVMTPETIAKLEEAFAWGCTDIEACLHADICKDALYAYQAENIAFVERKEDLKNHPYLLARQTMQKGLADSSEFALKYMERKKKDEFSIRNEPTGLGGKSVEITINISDALAKVYGQSESD